VATHNVIKTPRRLSVYLFVYLLAEQKKSLLNE